MQQLRRVWKTVADTALDLLYPPRCVLCGTATRDSRICDLCMPYLPRNGSGCRRCALPLAEGQHETVCCGACLDEPPPFVSARAPFVYAYPIDRAIKALKFDRKLYFADALGEFLLPEIASLPFRCDALLPVPLHRWRHARRGFNQASELCRPLRRATGLEIASNVRRSKPTRMQAGLSAADRRRNLRGAFTIVGKLRCRRPLIVDDVMTTGETCRQLAGTLLRGGAAEVAVLVVARSSPDQQVAAQEGTNV